MELITIFIILLQMNTFLAIMMIKHLIKERKRIKRLLQAKAGLPKKRTAFTLGIVSRLTEQKGFALFSYMMERLMKKPVQLYVLRRWGRGISKYVPFLSGTVPR